MLFPELKNKRSAEINLDREAQKWLATQPVGATNPLLNPAVCQDFIDSLHERLGVDFSYGGWLEDRSVLWRGSYLDEDQRYIHLGVDFNVPAATAVAVDHQYNILRIDSDYPEEYGWGTRVIMQEPGTKFVVVFAHLSPHLHVRVNEQLQPGAILGSVGVPPYNGGWFPHLHVQAIEENHYTELLKNNLRDLDGYGQIQDIEFLTKILPNPLQFISL